MNAPCPRCGAEVAVAPETLCAFCLLAAVDEPLRVGEGVEIVEEIGRGSMGTVYRARHRRLERVVAVKMLPAERVANDELRARFQREARALARLSHANVLAVYDAGEENGDPFIVMEYAAGGTVANALPVTAERAVAIALDVCRGLAYAHDRGIVHRDVKPSNILLDAEGRAKVADFGIARARLADADAAALTATGLVVGTPAYMAPEVLRGAPPEPRADVFSIGALLYEMVTGSPPAGSFPPLPGELGRIANRALAPRPEDRYQSAAELARELERLAARDDSYDAGEDEPWTSAMAGLLTLATCVVLWALLKSVTPVVLAADAVLPLVMIGGETLPDGRIVSRARFETWPTIFAIAAVSAALLGYGFLRGHWRRSPARLPPAAALRYPRRVLAVGCASLLLYLVRAALEAGGYAAARYVPIAGGLLEIVVVFLFWSSALEAARARRDLRGERALWLGVCLALLPPAVELLRYLTHWQP